VPAASQPALRDRLARLDARLPGNRRLHALGAGAIALGLCVLVAVLVVAGGGDAAPPADAATRLVPENALVYVHVSTDTARQGTDAARALAEGFPSYTSLRDRLLHQLSAPKCPVSARDVRGREAALALLDSSGGAAGSLVLVDTGRDQRDAGERRCGAVSVRHIGRFLAIGQPASLAQASALAGGKGRSLADNPAYRRATAGLPAGRAADAWASADGVRRLLAPQGGLLGAAGILLDRPGLIGTAAGLTAADHRARLTLKSIVDPKAQGASGFQAFSPTLAGNVPDTAMAYVGVKGIGGAAGRLLSAAGGAGLGNLLGTLGKQLGGSAGKLDPRVLDLVREEVAVVITPAVPAPTLTLIAKAGDEAATRRALARLEAPLSKILTAGGGTQAVFRHQQVAGVPAAVMRLGTGAELAYAVFDHKLVVSTKTDGIAQAKAAGRPLTQTDAYRATVGNASGPVTSVTFLDFSQLLRLGEQTGLNDSRAYQAVKDDLHKVRAVGALASGSGDESTVELVLEIS
jgi:hypothetical protein